MDGDGRRICMGGRDGCRMHHPESGTGRSSRFRRKYSLVYDPIRSGRAIVAPRKARTMVSAEISITLTEEFGLTAVSKDFREAEFTYLAGIEEPDRGLGLVEVRGGELVRFLNGFGSVSQFGRSSFSIRPKTERSSSTKPLAWCSIGRFEIRGSFPPSRTRSAMGRFTFRPLRHLIECCASGGRSDHSRSRSR